MFLLSDVLLVVEASTRRRQSLLQKPSHSRAIAIVHVADGPDLVVPALELTVPLGPHTGIRYQAPPCVQQLNNSKLKSKPSSLCKFSSISDLREQVSFYITSNPGHGLRVQTF